MRWLSVLAFALLAACQSEPAFDDRYDAAEEEIRKTAKQIDQEIKARAQKSEETESFSGQEAKQTLPPGKPVKQP